MSCDAVLNYLGDIGVTFASKLAVVAGVVHNLPTLKEIRGIVFQAL